jgi:hypothetical protein
VWAVVYHPGAETEYHSLSAADRNAVDNAVRNLETYGPALPYPHQSAVRGSKSLRELAHVAVGAEYVLSTYAVPTRS